jgi:uncharacterized protein YgiM (DUF1202 family)
MRLGSLALAALVLLGGTAWAASGDTLVVTGSRVNVRAGPGTDTQVTTQVSRDQQVIERDRQGEWLRVEIAGSAGAEGWIHSSLLAPAPAQTTTIAAPEPAAGPSARDLAGVQQFRASVDYLNKRALQVAGVDLFTGVEPAGGGAVRVSTTDAWNTMPPAGQRSYLNTLVDRWMAAKGGSAPGSVQIVDPSGNVVMEKAGP